jgi:hypothetical protein
MRVDVLDGKMLQARAACPALQERTAGRRPEIRLSAAAEADP